MTIEDIANLVVIEAPKKRGEYKKQLTKMFMSIEDMARLTDSIYIRINSAKCS
jgi:hypothetical protein